MKSRRQKNITLTQPTEKGESRPTRGMTLDRELLAILINIQEKLNSPVFNGGFENLVQAVQDIKESQRKTEEHIQTINKTIYEPDEGLFSRIKAVEADQDTEVQALKTRLEKLESFKDGVNKFLWLAIPGGLGLIIKTLWDILSAHIVLK